MNTTAQTGFTLLELVITVAIAGLLGAIALPNLFQQVADNRARTLLNILATDVQWARGQAASGGKQVTLTYNNPGCTWQVSVGGAADAKHSMASAQLASGGYGRVTCSGGTLTLTFNADGSVTGVPAAALQFSAGGQVYSALLLASGSVILNPSQAS